MSDPWIDLPELPESGKKVIAQFKNSVGKTRTICACHIAQYTEECDGNEECDFEYHEEREIYYTKEGWYEQIENWGDWNAIAVCEGEIYRWMNVPE